MTDLDFQYFSEIAKMLNFSKAAENLFITQSALSRCIQKIENELGAKLLERDRHGVRLTPAGEVLLNNYNTVQKANALLKEAIRNANALDTREVIRIGIQNGHLISEKLKEKIEDFSFSDTPVSIEVISLPYNELFHNLEEQMIDIALAFEFPFKSYALFDKKLLEEEPICILVGNDHPITRCKSIEERNKMLESMDLLCTGKEHQKNFFPFLLEQCRKEGFQPKGVKYYPTNIDMANALILGKGFLVINRTERMKIGHFFDMPSTDKMKFTAFRLKGNDESLVARFLDSL